MARRYRRQGKSGQVLATIETPQLDAQLMAAEAKLKSAEAQVVVEQANADFAKTTYERWKESPKGVVRNKNAKQRRRITIAASRSWQRPRLRST